MDNVLKDPRCQGLVTLFEKSLEDVMGKRDYRKVERTFIETANTLLQDNNVEAIDVYYGMVTAIANMILTWYDTCLKKEELLKENTGTDCLDLTISQLKITYHLLKLGVFLGLERNFNGVNTNDLVDRESSFNVCNSIVEDIINAGMSKG